MQDCFACHLPVLWGQQGAVINRYSPRRACMGILRAKSGVTSFFVTQFINKYFSETALSLPKCFTSLRSRTCEPWWIRLFYWHSADRWGNRIVQISEIQKAMLFQRVLSQEFILFLFTCYLCLKFIKKFWKLNKKKNFVDVTLSLSYIRALC